ncbi:MAG TPA: acyl-CoA reductase [Longimicrobiaceae bacterium]|nr:acyl-CoA reductase [Longimicrobiaceae bacterium]
MKIDAFHLPALPDPPTSAWPYGQGEGALELRVPILDAPLLKKQIAALVEARDRWLADRPVKEVVRVVDRVAARLQDAADPLRQAAEAALPRITGYSPPMVRLVLERMTAEWRADRLRALLRSELEDPGMLDAFRPRRHAPGRTRAFGPRLAAHVFSGNVPGVAVTSLVRSLLVKAATLGKTAVGEPLLAALFARGVAEEDAELGACLAVTYWPGGDEKLERLALGMADAVVVYGGAEAVASAREHTPAGTRVLAYGPKLSFGVVGREALGDAEQAAATARAAALDTSTFDQQGCVSPHLFYVEEGGAASPREWARLLAAAMEAAERDLPRGTLARSESSAIRQLRGEAELAQLAGTGVELHASAKGTTWTVVYDPDPAFAPTCLNRVVRVKPVPALDAVPGLAARAASLLQSVGVAAAPERAGRLAAALGRAGASRVAPLGRMAWPPGTWHHDGHPPLGELLRWCDMEE